MVYAIFCTRSHVDSEFADFSRNQSIHVSNQSVVAMHTKYAICPDATF